MLKIASDMALIGKLLSNNNPIIVPTESLFFQIQKTQNSHTENLIFEDSQELFRRFPKIPSYLKFLISALTPGPVEFIIQVEGAKKRIYIPDNLELFNLLKNQQDLVEYNYLKAKSGLFYTTRDMLKKGLEAESFLLDGKYNFAGFLPTLLDCSQENRIIIQRPGLTTKKDLKEILPKSVEVENGYFNKKLKTEILTNTYLESNATKTLVFGTKEQLNEVFGSSFFGYYKQKVINNYTLINLGSQTSPEIILKNIYKEVENSQNQAFQTRLFLVPKWEQLKWEDLFNSILSEFNFNFFELPEKSKEAFYLKEALI